ncbi:MULTISPECIES: hypothetical protein [unclassified Nocardia]|uniref:hypothetical protein n=1 Tax=unclassified Nocardia TaxID=2637762 RepID=UPI0024A894B6|nr:MULTISPECIES: hypothetical protein [unclassified Nocardia]
MRESEKARHESGVAAIIERIAVNNGGAFGVEVGVGRRVEVRPSTQRMAQPARVLFLCSVFTAVLLAVLLCVGVTFFGFLVFLF